MSLVGFTLLGSLEAPSLTGSASDVPLLVKPNTEFTVAMLASLDVGGGDLRFSSDEAGTTQLACEIVDGLDVVWVSTDGLSVATGLTIYVWGDNTGASQPAVGAAFGRDAVWVDYRAVYHLSETANTAAGGYLDSTGNGYDGTGISMLLSNRTTPSGLIGSGFNGTADYIDLPTSVFPTAVQDDFTVTAWAQPDTLTQDQRLVNLGDSTGNEDVLTLWMDKDAGGTGWAAITKVGDPPVNFIAGVDSNDAQAARWDYVGARVSSSQIQTLVNGSVGDTTAITEVNVGRVIDEAFIGRLSSTYMDGGISSLKISLATRDLTAIAIEYDNQSAVGAWWIAEDAGGAISVTESLTALTIDNFNPSIDFTGVVSVTESLTNLNLNSFNPTIGLTATLTVTESLTNLEFNSLDPIVTLTPPNTIIVTEATTSLIIDSFDPTITFSGTISVTESLTNLDFRAYRPTVQVGAKDYSNIFYGVAPQQVTFTGTSVSSTFSGTIKQAPDFSGIITTSTFSGVSK
jgi:hypothetical protein